MDTISRRPTLSNKEEMKIIQEIYFDRKESTELGDRANKRNKKQINQSR